MRLDAGIDYVFLDTGAARKKALVLLFRAKAYHVLGRRLALVFQGQRTLASPALAGSERARPFVWLPSPRLA